MAKPIKDLKDLRALRTPSAIDIKDLKDLREPETFFPQRERWRGTGPRATGHAEIERSRGTGPRATDPGTISYTEAMRGTGPRTTGHAEIERSRGTGPRPTGPGDDFLRQCNARDRPSRYGARGDREIARDRPSRYGHRGRFLTPIQREGQALALRASGTISYEGLYQIWKKEFDNFGEKWYHFKRL